MPTRDNYVLNHLLERTIYSELVCSMNCRVNGDSSSSRSDMARSLEKQMKALTVGVNLAVIWSSGQLLVQTRLTRLIMNSYVTPFA